MAKKYLYALLICFSLIAVILPQAVRSNSAPCEYHPEAYQGLEMGSLTQELTSTGLIGRIHGAASTSQMFVLSVREPNNFFSHREFSLIPASETAANSLKELHRHDLVCVGGDLIANASPQKHITLNSIEIIEPYPQPQGYAPYQRQTSLPEKLKAQTSLIGKVHAIGDEGKILVMGYEDLTIPVYVAETQYTANLYRGDIIKLNYQLQSYPQRPLHLQLDTTVEQPVEIIDAIATWHDQPQTLTGKLVKFPQSPQLRFDVYALEIDTQNIKRYFTLINFEDMTKFQNIREKLAKIWDDNADTAVAGRNMLINPNVIIEATGLGNIISTEQANPQLLLESAEQINQIADHDFDADNPQPILTAS
ncbi:MAG: hypothetical protein AAFO95_01395 [Cyanobacteria bacterium J06600_6]